MKKRDRGERKMNESEETEEIKTFPLIFTCCKVSRPCPTVSKYQLNDTFASHKHPTWQRVYSVFGTLVRKFMLDLEVFCRLIFYLFFFFFFFFFWTAQKWANKMIVYVYGRWIIISKNVDCHRQRLFCELSESKGSNQLEINRNRT